jgi:CheY-like chemotaxis protein
MRMPGMDGCEVYDRLKAIQQEIKIIIVSGYIDQRNMSMKIRHSHR